jgi:putative ABC transport system ATP-binding protein
MSALSLRGVYAAYPDGAGVRVLLDHVDLDVAPGEVVVVTGASGSGKSTLLALAGLLRRPADGDVLIAGTSTARLSERKRTALRAERIGLIYQSANLVPTLTAREQLELVGHIAGAPRAATRARADDLLAELGLTTRAGALPAQLSGGERQRVGIARALMGRPQVLLADEPTASLDPALAEEVAAMLAEQTRKHQLATVIVTHDDAPRRHADRHLALHGGTVQELALSS